MLWNAGFRVEAEKQVWPYPEATAARGKRERERSRLRFATVYRCSEFAD
jgi:hypothetical protein